MAQTGISRIDDLLEGQSSDPIGVGDPDKEAVGIIHDLLIGHGFTNLPGLLGQARGQFGPQTSDAVRTFQQNNNVPRTGFVDRSTLQAMVFVLATRPTAGRGYLTLVLDFIFSGMTRLMSLTTQFEAAGLFTAVNHNSDKAGLSFGLIQWAQKPGRLNELLRAFQAEHPQAFGQVFGDGNTALAQGLIDHTAKPRGGTDDLGKTVDSKFDLIADPWISRFHQAGLSRDLQRVQVNTALRAFRESFQRLQAFAPQIRSERGIALMLDLANQHGDGGAKDILAKAQKPGLSEADLLLAIENESVMRVRAQFGEGAEVQSTQNRREAFRTSSLLSGDSFNPL